MYATTITAEATAKGRAGISIVRLSGDKAFEICKLITKKNILDSPKLRILCGLYEKYDSDNSFDEALVIAFPKPNSFTGEDLIEFHCHGNPLIVSKLLNSLLNYGASLAKPGEFSQRAFMNGKLDLAQAEALMDIIHSRSEKLLSASTNQLKGGLGKAIDKVKQEILQALALIHGPMDFPLETEFQEVDLSTVKKIIQSNIQVLIGLEKQAKNNNIFRQGLKTVILGKPNVGKSSLLNCLLNSERAIVSPEAGTTRDYLKEEIIIKDIPIVLIDTAGLRENSLNSIERIGIEKSLELASNADLVIYVFDANHGVDDLEKKQINTIQESNPAAKFVFVANKADLLDQNNKKLQKFFFEGTVFASCKSSTGINELENTIEKLVLEEDFSEVELAINNRQGSCIKQALGKLHQAFQLSDPELISVVLQKSIASLQEVACQSQHFSDSMLEEVFGNFCIGK